LLEQRLAYGGNYFLGYIRYEGLLEKDLRDKRKTSRSVEQDSMMRGKGGRAINPICGCNAANENIGYPGDASIGYVFEHGCDGDVWRVRRQRRQTWFMLHVKRATMGKVCEWSTKLMMVR